MAVGEDRKRPGREYSPSPAARRLIDEIVKKWDACKSHHDSFVKFYERQTRAYEGVLAAASDAAKWRHKSHPPYGFNLIETIVSNTVEMGLQFDVRPAPWSNVSLEEAMHQLDQAEAVEDLLRHEHRVDEMDLKQRPLYLNAAICGRGIGKGYWNYTEGSVRRQGIRMEQVTDDEGNVLLEVPVIGEIIEEGVLRDHSTFEVVDPRDFVLHESAKKLQPFEPGGAQYLFHRCWYSYEQLKMLEAAGFVKDVDFLIESRSQSEEYDGREKRLHDIDYTKDLIQVLEYWCMSNGVVKRALVGNGKVLLRDDSLAGGEVGELESSPFWHGGYPFVIATTMPALNSPYGKGDMELIEQLQEMLWELGNQTFDNVEQINNYVTLVRDDEEYADGWEHYPGALWTTSGNPKDAVMALQPPYQLADVTLRHLALIKGDLQNVTAAAPFASGTETATVDQKTATGASLVMSAAQQRLLMKKYMAQRTGLVPEANMRIKNCQQFIGDQKLISIIGHDGAMRFRELSQLQIQGEYFAEIEPMGESNMREQKRAEATNFFQVAMQFAPLLAAAGHPPNVRELFGWWAKKYGVTDWERFFSQQQAAMGVMAAGGGAGAPAGGGAPTEPNLGITAGSAIDASSPSAAGGISQSPMTAMHRALAMGGGVQNT